MRRVVALVIPLVLGLALSACGYQGTTQPVAETVVGPLTVPKTTTSPAAALPKGNAAAGKAIFVTKGCSGCHTMKAANATGTVGPNLDQLKPPLDKIEQQVINGGGPMPPYKGQLSDQQIADVSQYVYESTH